MATVANDAIVADHHPRCCGSDADGEAAICSLIVTNLFEGADPDDRLARIVRLPIAGRKRTDRWP